MLVIDDWNWEQVRCGTLDAIRVRNYHVDCMIEIWTTSDNSHAQVTGAVSDWHNGYLLAVLSKEI